MVIDLPFGQQKLIGLARTLMNDGGCLLLDEPMAGVEGAAYETMQRVVRQEAAAGRAVCVVEHNVSFHPGSVHPRGVHGERANPRSAARWRT